MFRVGSCSSNSGDEEEEDIWIKQNPENTPMLRALYPYVPKPLIPRNRLSSPSCSSLASASYSLSCPEVVVRRRRKACSETGSDVTDAETSFHKLVKYKSAMPTNHNSSSEQEERDLEFNLDLGLLPCRPTEPATGGRKRDAIGNPDLRTREWRATEPESSLSHGRSYSNDESTSDSDTENPGIISGAEIKSLKPSISGTSWVASSVSGNKNSVAKHFLDFIQRTPGTCRLGTTGKETQDLSFQNTGNLAINLLKKPQNTGAVKMPENEFRDRNKLTVSGTSLAVTCGSDTSPGSEAAGGISSSLGMDLKTKLPAFRGGLSLALGGVNYHEGDIDGTGEGVHRSSEGVGCSSQQRSSSETPDQLESKRTIRKLRRELEAAQEKVNTLTTQLSTNAHVVAAFEQSLASMTQRLQQLTNTSQQKDSELNDLKETIEALRLQSKSQVANSGGGAGAGGGGGGDGVGDGSGSTLPRQSTDQTKDSTCSGIESPIINRHMSADSVASLNSLSSSASQHSAVADLDKKKKKKNWLKNSFTKAFSRKKGKQGSGSDFDADSVSLKSDTSISNSLMLGAGHPMSTPTTPTRAIQLSALMMKPDIVSAVSNSSSRDETVFQLKQELHEKDLKLTDIQLEALASAHQLEQLYETMNRMKSEMSSLKANNERLQRIIAQRGLDPSLVVSRRIQNSLEDELSPESNQLSLEELATSEVNSNSIELTGRKEGKRVLVSVLLGSVSDVGSLESKPREVLIGALLVSKSTKWESFESTLRRAFKEYMTRIEPSGSMGLNTDSILMYRASDVIRTKSSRCPDVSPYDCLKDQTETVSITLKGTQENSVDCLSFETLIPKAIMQRYVSLLLEHRRIILCGPSGTGKSYLAQKLAEYVISVSGKDLLAGLVATFNVDHKSSKELRQYLANIAEQCEHNAADLPSIIILDNLHHVGSLSEVFTGFLSVKHKQCPYIIGTMNQTTCSTTNLQLHHNFRWVLCANHMEPVKGFLGRYLRHRLVEEEVRTGVRNQEMNKIADWLPKVWQYLNKFLETHSSSDVTIGPRLFLACPMDVTNAQVWFTDLWNYSIVPYLLEAVREGIQTYGHRAPWEDPAEWVIETYPWDRVDMPTLLHLRTEDVGYDPQGGGLVPGKLQTTSSDTENKDPLMNMLLRLQEAANYSSPPSNESDSTSLDSHESRVCGSTPKSPISGDAKT